MTVHPLCPFVIIFLELLALALVQRAGVDLSRWPR